jgi:hypothetical protein
MSGLMHDLQGKANVLHVITATQCIMLRLECVDGAEAMHLLSIPCWILCYLVRNDKVGGHGFSRAGCAMESTLQSTLPNG